ncbi:MAG: hypothetical protein IJY57_02755 [Clostridia bacterium]|nr:hypothetical protein [Clostridia bacterium]
MNERKIKVDGLCDRAIKDLSILLTGASLNGADYYYESDEYHCPYFKVEIPYEKEQEYEPEEETFFIDVENEFTVHTRFGHEHFDSAKSAVTFLENFINGSLCEVAMVFGDVTFRIITLNTGDHEKNVSAILSRFETIKEYYKSVQDRINESTVKQGGHFHMLLDIENKCYVQIIPKRSRMFDNSSCYAVSVVAGKQTEYYIYK